jgi:hypothetical protein
MSGQRARQFDTKFWKEVWFKAPSIIAAAAAAPPWQACVSCNLAANYLDMYIHKMVQKY